MPQSTFLDFCREQLPPAPARLLEVGCGHGELTTALSVDGYDVLGIDPRAPQGDLFRRVLLEDLDPEEERFDAVVASHSLHHIRDLEHALDRVVALVGGTGRIVLDEFGWDLIDEQTLDWLWTQRRALAAAGHGDAPPASPAALREEWEAEHVGVHRFETMRAGLAARFDEVAFEPGPFMWRKTRGVATEVLETALIDAGAIRAIGFRYAGDARPG